MIFLKIIKKVFLIAFKIIPLKFHQHWV